jgi:hypothetical protein
MLNSTTYVLINRQAVLNWFKISMNFQAVNCHLVYLYVQLSFTDTNILNPYLYASCLS